MKQRLAVAITAVLGVTAVAALPGVAKPGGGGLDTTRPAQLVPTRKNVEIDPILSTGDRRGGYQMSGIPDGLGAYIEERRRRKDRLQVLMNHELNGTAPAGVGARVSQLELDPETRRVRDASYPIDGTEGFLRFCSAYLERIAGEPLFFAGEESTDDGSLTPDPSDGLGRGGSSVALDGETGEFRETRHLGLLPHENIVPVKRLSDAVLLSTEDGDPKTNQSQLYAYIAPSFKGAISGKKGSLHVWKANKDEQTDGEPSTNDIEEGEEVNGRFRPVSQAENADADTLEATAQAKRAFDFVRLEDAAPIPGAEGSLYIADTGALGSESTRGRLYRFELDEDNPKRASLTLELDADEQVGSSNGPRLVNPDNIDTSEDSVVIQEDRNAEHRGGEVEGGFGRVLVYDIESEELRKVARVDTPPPLQPGEWESSGVINAFDLLGKNRWLLDVQAHKQTAPQPGPDLTPDSSSGEDGQLLEIKIPNS